MQLYGACVCMYVCVSSPSATPGASTPRTLCCEYVRVCVPCEYLYVCVCVYVHFRTKRLPVLYVFGQEEVSPEACAAAFGEAFPDPEEHVIVFCDVVYTHCMGERFAHSHKVNELQSWF